MDEPLITTGAGTPGAQGRRPVSVNIVPAQYGGLSSGTDKADIEFIEVIIEVACEVICGIGIS